MSPWGTPMTGKTLSSILIGFPLVLKPGRLAKGVLLSCRHGLVTSNTPIQTDSGMGSGSATYSLEGLRRKVHKLPNQLCLGERWARRTGIVGVKGRILASPFAKGTWATRGTRSRARRRTNSSTRAGAGRACRGGPLLGASLGASARHLERC
jgi:hypothetical protein